MLDAVECIKNNIEILWHIMRTLNGIGVIAAVTIIALAGIALLVAASVPLPVYATDVMTSPTGGGGEEAPSTTSTNNNSNAVSGSLFFIGEYERTSFNPINETYTEISYLGNVTIMPPNATATTTISATETVNITVDIQPNSLGFVEGQSLLVTERDDGAEENATTTSVDISRTNPDGTGSGTGVAFFSTNSTGQLAFLDNTVGISQVEISPEGSTVRMWEWKGETLPFESGAATVGNQTLSP
jgi:hypothetical protein